MGIRRDKMKNRKKKNGSKPVKKTAKVSNNLSEAQLEAIGLEAERIYKMFIVNMGKSLDDQAVYNCVIEWKNYISKYYYECNDVTLAKLGHLYVSDKRFTEDLDQFQIGLAGFMSQAIQAYLKRNQPKLVKQAKVEEPTVVEEKKAVKKTVKKTEKAEKVETKKPAAKKTTKKTEEIVEEKAPAKKAAAKKAPAKKTVKKADKE